MKNVIAIILARGGSKEIPRKNLLDFCGKPLVAWSIIQAKQCKQISSVWISSDDKEILKVGEEYGAKKILRPQQLVTDNATSESGWLHGIETIENNGETVDLVIGIQTTSPIRESKDFTKALEIFEKKNCDSMFSASKLKDFFIWNKTNNHEYISANYDYRNRKLRQNVQEQYVENGSFYIFKPEILRKNNNRLHGKIEIYEMDFWKSFEIDSYDDIELCETLMKHYILRNESLRKN